MNGLSQSGAGETAAGNLRRARISNVLNVHGMVFQIKLSLIFLKNVLFQIC